MTTFNDFYVYTHRDTAGRVFYVGKGRGKRAWSKDRDAIWKRYVAERSGGTFDVEILQGDLTEESALELEWEWITKLGPQLVNWENPGRAIDAIASEEYWLKRKKSQGLIAEAKQLGKSDPNTAVDLCRQALALVDEYMNLTLETGLVAELNESPRLGDPNVIYRLAQSLKQAENLEAIPEVVDAYMEKYPAARNHSQGKAALKLRDIAARTISPTYN